MIGDTSGPLRDGEQRIDLPSQAEAGVFFIGTIRTPWKHRSDCPRRGDAVEGPVCRIEVHEPWVAGLAQVDSHRILDILYWMHLARRDLVRQNPKRRGDTFGTFSIRSPVRPNPIAMSSVSLIGIEAHVLLVRGLDCIDGTPLIDIKPSRCPVADRTAAQP